MKQVVTIGPFASQFFNKNNAMNLRGHWHFCQVTLEYRTTGTTGFPAFEATYRSVQSRLRELMSAPFRDATNEKVAQRLFEGFDGWTDDEIRRWGGAFQLDCVHLDVRGVPDDIGHADGFTRYTVIRDV
jgi:hypothetical protein